MSPTDWAAVAAAFITVTTAFVAVLKFLIKHYLSELKPNSGSSLRDSVNRLEERVDRIYEMLLNK